MFFSAASGTPMKRTLSIARTRDINGSWQLDSEPILPLAEQIENSASCDRQTFCGCDFQGLGREWHWGILTSDVPSPICDTAVTRL